MNGVVVGHIEALGRQGVRGWLAGPVHDGLRLSVQVAGRELARIATPLHRADVVAAGLADGPHCGFEFLFPAPLSEAEVAQVQVLRLADGVPLTISAGVPPLALYPRLFDGSYARDNHVAEGAFLSMHYLRHNARRLEHLASLGLPLHGRSVVEFGAGVGDHTSFYLDRGCTVTATDARPDNLALLRERLRHHPDVGRLTSRELDVERPFDPFGPFDVVHCYGLLYHLGHPAEALSRMAACCQGLFLLETKCHHDDEASETFGDEDAREVYHAFSGRNFRPGRRWLQAALQRDFAHVYFVLSGPSHEEFPASPADISRVPDGWPRTVMVASREPLAHPLLSTAMPTAPLRRA